MAPTFNSDILIAARGSRGRTQSELARHMRWSQGRASKVEHGLLRPNSKEVERLADFLEYPTELFYVDATVTGFGTCCLYHRKRASTPVRTLNRLHDDINIRRIQLTRLLKGVTLPNEFTFPLFDIDEYESPEDIARMLRAAWRLPRGPIRNLADVVESAGGIVVLADLRTPKIDAVSQRAHDIPPVFFLDRDKPVDRCRWTLAHEIGHIVMHTMPTPDAEKEADRFASEFLMPEREIKHELENLTIAGAANLKLKWRVSMQALIYRAKAVGAINAAKCKSLYVRISQLGYRRKEPNELQPEIPKMLPWIIEQHLCERGYSVAELSAAMLCREDHFRRDYLDEFRLKVIR